MENKGPAVSKFGLDEHGLDGVRTAYWNLPAARLVEMAEQLRIPAYLLVNNRAEGSAPRTIAAVAALLAER